MNEFSPSPRKPRGRLFFANPGPTNIPDSILRAMSHHTVDFMDPAFMEMYARCVDGVKRVLKTSQTVMFCTGSGHAAWEASLTNLFSPGDRLLLLESGHFSESWGRMAHGLGLATQIVPADWRKGATSPICGPRWTPTPPTPSRPSAWSITKPPPASPCRWPRSAPRWTRPSHPALLLADTISSLGSIDFRMDEWGIDAAVGGSQKGLMLPTGLSFTGVSDKAMAAHRIQHPAEALFQLALMLARPHQSFIGTVPANFFFGLRESLRLIEEEGLENVFARHSRLAEAVRRCVRALERQWRRPQLFCEDPARFSNSVTAILMPDGYDADALRRTAIQRFNVSLGGGLGPLRRQSLPHRPSRRPERADAARHAGRGGNGPEAQRRAAHPRRRRRRDGPIWPKPPTHAG